MNNLTTLRNGLIAVFFVIVPLVGYDIQHTTPQVKAVAPVESPVPSPTPFVEPSNPKDYITYIFGEEGSKKAFIVLQGKGEGTCAENRHLDQKAVNDNRTWGGIGRDVGIFQINDVYHPVKELNLEQDWKANIRYAKRMFDNDGGTFSKRWTCGKYYKSLGYDI